jgi:protein-tyrosine-phosphatase
VGVFDFLKRRRDKESAIPDPDSGQFQRQVEGSALAGSAGTAGVEPDQWKSVDVGQSQTIDMRGSGAREEIIEALKKHGINPDDHGQQVDASSVPGLREELIEILEKKGLDLPGD